jgi:hypothetical protein
MEEIRQHLEDYYAAQTKIFISAGFQESMRVRRRAGDRLNHMRWFIKFQILGRPANQIAKQHRPKSVSVTAIKSAVHAIAIALPTRLRP